MTGMKTDCKIYLLSLFAAIISCFVSCAPQVHYMNVDVRQQAKIALPQARTAALFPVSGKNRYDSVRVGNVAVGVAEKIEEDRGLRHGSVAVWGIRGNEFLGFPGDGGEKLSGESREYLRDLSANSGANLLIFVRNLHFLPYSVNTGSLYSQYEGSNVTVPFAVALDIYDAAADTLVYATTVTDSLYLFVDASVSSRDMGAAIARYLPDISKKIGTILGSDLSPQWITQERLLFNCDGDTMWDEAHQLALDFRWEEAIEKWAAIAENGSPRRSACAAYNIAVGCEMLEGFDLAIRWLDYSLKLFPMKESVIFRKYLEEKNRPENK